MLVKRLLPLGFTRAAILKELNKTSEDVNLIALHLLEEERKSLEEKEQNKQKMKLKSLEVIKIRIRGREGGREGGTSWHDVFVFFVTTMDYSPWSEREIWPNLKANFIFETGEATPGVPAFHIYYSLFSGFNGIIERVFD